MSDVHGSRTVNDRPLSERVFEELMASDCWCEKCKAHAEEVRDEIAALEAAKEGWYNTTVQLRAGIAALEAENKRLRHYNQTGDKHHRQARKLTAEVKALCAHRDSLEAERDRLRWHLREWCVCEEGRRCRFCAALEEGGDG